MKTIILICCLGIVPFAGAQNATIGTTPVTIDTVFTGSEVVWEILWGPDSHLWVTEKHGVVSRIDPYSHQRVTVLNIEQEVFHEGEAGLLGMALHPDFPNTPELFLVYTYGTSSNIRERLVKYTYTGTTLISPVVLIDNIAGYTSHDGSRLLFLSDNTLLMTTGDAQNTNLPQDLNSLNGKVLRINTDGSIPADNPFPGKRIYSYGHRNPQGLCMMPDGSVYISEHGPSNDDEFQPLIAGANYGWPNVEGFCNTPAELDFCAQHEVQEPIVAWTPTIAPGDLVYYNNPAFPEFDGRFLMAVLKDKKIRTLKLNGAGDSLVSTDDYLINSYGRLRAICVGPQKEIYVGTNQNAGASIISIAPPAVINVNEIKYTSIDVFPAQVVNTLTVDLGDTVFKALDAKFVDMSGRIIDQKTLTEQLTELDVSKLSAGYYSFIIERDKEVLFQTEIIK